MNDPLVITAIPGLLSRRLTQVLGSYKHGRTPEAHSTALQGKIKESISVSYAALGAHNFLDSPSLRVLIS